MYINLDFESTKPIYTQLVEQVIAGIACKQLLPGERLPSVRSLAADIGINMHTVNKAYQELRDREFILIHRQRGVVIHPDGTPKADESYIEQLEENLHPLIAESICRGLSQQELAELMAGVYKQYLNKAGEE